MQIGNASGEKDAPILVFIGDKNGEHFRCRHKDVLDWGYKDPEHIEIVFKDSPEKPYLYPRERVALYSEKECYEGKWYVSLIDNRRVSFERALLLEPDIEHAPKLIRLVKKDGFEKDYPANKVAVVAKAAASGLFRYLQKIEEEKGRGGDQYLFKRFEWLANFTIDGRAAAVFLKPEAARPAVSGGSGDFATIYPFGCNLSQMKAVDNALSSTVSLIEGPPGTGKTQTILNIIANLLIRGDSILVASPNNSATDNVIEKLERENLAFLVARLGNKDNQAEFIEQQLDYPDDAMQWLLPDRDLERLQESIAAAVPKMREAFVVQRQLATDRETLRQWELQQRYFLQHFGEVKPLHYRKGVDVAHLYDLRNQLANLADGDKSLGMLSKLLARFVRGIGKWSDFAASPVELELRVSRTIFAKEIARLQEVIVDAENKLRHVDADALMADVTSWSRAVLFAKLADKYKSRFRIDRVKFTKRHLTTASVRNEYPIVTSTVNAVLDQCDALTEPFDYVIIDESSQCNLTTGLLALSSAKRAVVVGDTKQLPCVVSGRDAMIADDAFDARLDERYRYSSESLLSCLEKCAEAAPDGAIPVQLLAEHYRCHPAIIRFCNQRFYDGSLVVMRDERGLPAKDALTLLEAEGHDSARDYNRGQAGVALEKGLSPLLEAGLSCCDIGVVTPYRNQADGMTGNDQFQGIEVDTVYKYQGREKDAMVFVTKVGKTTRFVDDPNLVNVAVSRAKERLVLVAAPGLLKGDGNIAELSRYISYQGGRHIQADEPTMFDLLYAHRESNQEWIEQKTIELKEDTLSELIVEDRLNHLLNVAGMKGRVGFVRNYPLKMFMPKSLDLTRAESGFVDASAHADFLFFRIVDKRPLAVLEIDGSLHDTPVQKHRDELKDSIMSKVNMPLWRLRTNEYKPDEWLEEKVREVGVLADNNGSAVCRNVIAGEEK